MSRFPTELLLRSVCTQEEKRAFCTDFRALIPLFRAYRREEIDIQTFANGISEDHFPFLFDAISSSMGEDDWNIAQKGHSYILNTDPNHVVLRKLLELQFLWCFRQRYSISLLKNYFEALLEGEEHCESNEEILQDIFSC